MKTKTTKQTEILFDTNTPQIVTIGLVHKGREIEVSHTLKFPSDEQIKDYYLARKVEAKISSSGVETSDAVYESAVNLWDELAITRAGYKDNDRADWKEKTPISHKEKAIDTLLDARAVTPKVSDEDFQGFDEEDTEIISLESYYNGKRSQKTQLVFNQPNAEQMRRYQNIKDENVKNGEGFVTTIVVIDVVNRAELAKKLLVKSIGYKNNVPIHHLALGAKSLFEKELFVIEKN